MSLVAPVRLCGFHAARVRLHNAARCASMLLASTGMLLLTADRRLRAQAVGERRLVDKQWVALWRTSGDGAGELFGLPREIVATRDGFAVLDVGTLQLSAFALNGSRRWTVGRKGSGPGEFRRPVDLTLMPNGNIAVLDAGNGRVEQFSANGEHRSSHRIATASIAKSFCASTDGRFHFVSGGGSTFVTTTESTGRVVRTSAFPWPRPNGSVDFLSSALFARGEAGANCVLATTFGFGIATVSASGVSAAAPFVEAVPLPVIKRERSRDGSVRDILTSGDNAALASFRWRDTLFVNFAGASAQKFRVLDLYDARGGYLESWPLPMGGWFAYANGFLYAVVDAHEAPSILAFVAAADTSRVFKMWPKGRQITRPAPPPPKKRQPGN